METVMIVIIALIGILVFVGIFFILVVTFNIQLGPITNLAFSLWCLLKINISPERWFFGWLPGPDMPGGFAGCP